MKTKLMSIQYQTCQIVVYETRVSLYLSKFQFLSGDQIDVKVLKPWTYLVFPSAIVKLPFIYYNIYEKE